MSYQVRWDYDAVVSLQLIYDAAIDKEELKNAITRVGLELARKPHSAGESREPGTRVFFQSPIIVWFFVDERMKDVVIYKVRPMRP